LVRCIVLISYLAYPPNKARGFALASSLSKDLVVGEIGELGEALRREINTRLRETYQL
jgi:hypothetical protein